MSHVTETTCYRHPDRRAGVACQRCDRPICPSCMVTASVGFQCPDCVKGAQGPQRKFEAAQRRMNTPYTVYALVGINVFLFVMERANSSLFSGPAYETFSQRFMLFAGSPLPPDQGVSDGEWWRVITSGFLHASPMHLAFNMWALWVLGTVLEKVLGRTSFILIYTVSLIGGSFGALALTDPLVGTVGASGAIFGLMGAFVMLQLSRGQNPMDGGVGIVILLNLFLTFAIPNISVGGHLGGLIAGAASGALLVGYSPASARKQAEHPNTMMGVVAALGLLLFIGCFIVANQAASNSLPVLPF